MDLSSFQDFFQRNNQIDRKAIIRAARSESQVVEVEALVLVVLVSALLAILVGFMPFPFAWLPCAFKY